MLVYFYKGVLPWQGLKLSDKAERNRSIYRKKRTTDISTITSGMPSQFHDYIQYCRLLRFSQNPDYDYLIGLFQGLLDYAGEKNDCIFDWNIVAQQKKKIQLRIMAQRWTDNIMPGHFLGCGAYIGERTPDLRRPGM